MKKFYLLTVLALALLFTACAQNMRVYRPDKNTGEKKLRSEVTGRIESAEMVDAFGRQMTIAELTAMVSDTSLSVEARTLAGELVLFYTSRYPQTLRWGTVQSHATESGTGTPGPGSLNASATQIPGAFFFEGNYYLNEDSLRQHPMASDLAAMYYRRPDLRQNLLNIWGISAEKK